MKKYLLRTLILSIVVLCVFAMSACNMENNPSSTVKTIDNLQEYLPNVQSKTLVFQYNGNTDHDNFQYTYINENQINWTETYRTNGKLTRITDGYDYYNPETKEISKTIISNTVSEYGTDTYLIGEFNKEFISDNYSCRIIGDNGTVTSVAGTFNNCLIVEIQLDEATTLTKYYAPDLGYVYGEVVSNGNSTYKEYIISYIPFASSPNTSSNSNAIEPEGDVDDYMDNLHRWYLKKTTFENTETNHTLYVEVAGDTLRFIMDGQFLAGTALLDETDYFPDFNGYTANEENGTFTVRYYPDKGYIRIIDKVDDRVDYSGVYEYKDK